MLLLNRGKYVVSMVTFLLLWRICFKTDNLYLTGCCHKYRFFSMAVIKNVSLSVSNIFRCCPSHAKVLMQNQYKDGFFGFY